MSAVERLTLIYADLAVLSSSGEPMSDRTGEDLEAALRLIAKSIDREERVDALVEEGSQ